ncbi:Vinculin family-domain-containing protein [Globomyces pollinis-pini]|nr:Vinculin family-domain-containing protein [Globomyces pollinis-pini]
MHTKTSKQVLSPLADAVSALIVIISDSEISGAATPDLTQLSKAVQAQIQNLIIVAKKIANQPSVDESIKVAMPIACNQVSDASTLLISATADLVMNPVSGKGRNDLLEAVKGILQGTTRILDVFDDSEIHKILKLTKLLRSLLNSISIASLDSDQQKQYIHLLKRTTQAIFGACQLAQKRTKEIVSIRLADTLQECIHSIVQESNYYITATRMVLQWPDSVEAKQVQNISFKRIENESYRIDDIVCCKDSDDYYTQQSRGLMNSNTSVDDTFNRLKDELLGQPLSVPFKESPEATQNKCDEFIKSLEEKIKSVQVPLQYIQSNQLSKINNELMELNKVNAEQLNEALKDASLVLNEAELDHNGKQYLLALSSTPQVLESNIQRGIIATLISTLGNLSDPSMTETVVGKLTTGVLDENIPMVKQQTMEFETCTGTLDKLLTHVMANLDSSNPYYGTLTSLQEKSKTMGQSVIACSQLYQKHPNDNSKDHLQNNILSFSNVAMGLQKLLVSTDAIYPANDLIQAAHANFVQHSTGVLEALTQKDPIAAKRALNLTGLAALQLVRIAEREKDNSEDPVYRQALETEIAFVRESFPTLLEKTSHVLGTLDNLNVNDLGDLKNSIQELVKQFTSVGKVIKNYKGSTDDLMVVPAVVPFVDPSSKKRPETGDASQSISVDEEKKLVMESTRDQDDHLRSLTSAIKELVIIHEEAPKRLSECEAKENPIKAAGQDLKVEASHWASEQNPIVISVNKIGQKFLELSEFHQKLSTATDPMAKRSFIQTAQDIMAETNLLIQAVQPLIDACADKRLCLQIKQTASKLSTLAQTLKVIAAVKASSPKDTDKAIQLVSNGQNLVQSVKMILRDSISCSLRLKKGTNSDLVRFRKAIYAKK